MNFNEAPEFKKDLKALRKRVPTLNTDLERVRPSLQSLYIKPDALNDLEWREYREQFFDNRRAAKLKGYPEQCDVVKLRLDTDTDQYRGKLRLVFTAIKKGNEILFVELYSKNDKPREDQNRIKKYVKISGVS